jgi:hypothetical protein
MGALPSFFAACLSMPAIIIGEAAGLVRRLRVLLT